MGVEVSSPVCILEAAIPMLDLWAIENLTGRHWAPQLAAPFYILLLTSTTTALMESLPFMTVT